MTKTIRLGLLRLSDAAPVILAYDGGIFAANGLEVVLSIEPSWANIADKLSFGLIDGAVMLPPLAIACAGGLRGRKTDLVVPMSLSANGNAITLAARCHDCFKAYGISGVLAKQRLRLAVVHGFSTHDLLLRYWLAAHGINPDSDVEIAVLPPAEMVGSLAADAIDGFCAGAPWGQMAAYAGLGFIALHTSEIWHNHPEKCLALRADLVARDPSGVLALLTALRQASALCAEPVQRAPLAALLAAPEFLDLPAELIAAALDPADGGPLFSQQYPVQAHALWFAGQMLRWGKAPHEIMDVASQLYQPELFLQAGGKAIVARPERFFNTTAKTMFL